MPPSRGVRRVVGLAAHVAPAATAAVAVPERPAAATSAAVPVGFDLLPSEAEDEEVAAHLRWIAQKFELGQDIVLLGPPGALRRQLALRFCELQGLEAEVLTVTRDTTEADLKQRRELTTGPSGTRTAYADGPPVRCAVRGRVLILDGLEKAERNVLPTLNNLLENREMALDDGRFLVAAKRFDSLPMADEADEAAGLGGAEGDRSRLVRVHEGFRVIALGLPCPPCLGNPLDPPLRSRFQARVVRTPSLASAARLAAVPSQPSVDPPLLQRLETLQRALNAHALGGAEAADAAAEAAAALPPGMRLPALSHDGLQRIVRLVSGAGVLPAGARPSAMEALVRAYPLELMAAAATGAAGPGEALKDAALHLIGTFGLDGGSSSSSSSSSPPRLGMEDTSPPLRAALGKRGEGEGGSVLLDFGCGAPPVELASPALDPPPNGEFVASLPLERLTAALAQDFALGHDCLLIGPPGCGKSALARRLASLLGHGAPGGQGLEFFFLYEEMSSRDLLQRRATDASGRTCWADSPLVRAARTGALCVLDGVHRVRWDVLCALAPLLQDRQACLAAANDPSGADAELLLRPDRFSTVLERLRASGSGADAGAGLFDAASNCRLAMIHPSFRVLALAEPPSAKAPWLCDELASCFSHHVYPDLAPSDLVDILTVLLPSLPAPAAQRLVAVLAPDRTAAIAAAAAGPGVVGAAPVAAPAAVPLRVLIRVARRAAAAGDAAASVDSELLTGILQQALFPFLPRNERAELLGRLRGHFHPDDVKAASAHALRHSTQQGPGKQAAPSPAAGDGTVGSASEDLVPIGNFLAPRGRPTRPELVPSVEFVDIGRHTELLEDLARALFQRDERFLLLLGPQGVGKNRVVDHLLQTLRLEREYMQLHRDTTVAQLTATPAVVGGRLLYEDSPLVRAAQHGRVLVLDEADKAPLEVVIVLKSLVEDGQLALPDGRRLARFAQAAEQHGAGAAPQTSTVPIHPSFRMLVLANRPGFPFLGNDLIREADVFSVFCLDNPDAASELQLVRAIGPRVPEAMLRSLVGIFADLRMAVEEGRLQYPYSTRELLAVVRHLDRFPEEPLEGALASILAFDRFDPAVREVLRPIFEKRGLPTSAALGAPLEMDAGAQMPEPWMRALPTLKAIRLAATSSLGPPVLAGAWSASDPLLVKARVHFAGTRALALDRPQPAPLPELLFDRAQEPPEFSESVVRARLPLGSRAGPVLDAVAALEDDDIMEDGEAGTGRTLHILSASPLSLWTLEDPLATGAQAGRCSVLHLGPGAARRQDALKAGGSASVLVNGRAVELGTPQLLWVPNAGTSGGLLLHSPTDSSNAQVLVRRPHREDAAAEAISAPPLRPSDGGMAVEDSFVAVPIASWEGGPSGRPSAGSSASGGADERAVGEFAPVSSVLFFQPRRRRLVQLDVALRRAREVLLDGALAADRSLLERLRGTLGLARPGDFSLTASATSGGVEVLVHESLPGAARSASRFLALFLPQGSEQAPSARWIEARPAPSTAAGTGPGAEPDQALPPAPVLPAVAGAGLATAAFASAGGMAFAAAAPAGGLAHVVDGLRNVDGSRSVWELREQDRRLHHSAKAAVSFAEDQAPSPPKLAELARAGAGAAGGAPGGGLAEQMGLDVAVGPELPVPREECEDCDVTAPSTVDLLVRVLRQPASGGDWIEAVHARTRSARRLPARPPRELDADVGGGPKAGVARALPWPSPAGGRGVWDQSPDVCVVFRDGAVRFLELHPESLERSLRAYLSSRGLSSLMDDGAQPPPGAEVDPAAAGAAGGAEAASGAQAAAPQPSEEQQEAEGAPEGAVPPEGGAESPQQGEPPEGGQSPEGREGLPHGGELPEGAEPPESQEGVPQGGELPEGAELPEGGANLPRGEEPPQAAGPERLRDEALRRALAEALRHQPPEPAGPPQSAEAPNADEAPREQPPQAPAGGAEEGADPLPELPAGAGEQVDVPKELMDQVPDGLFEQISEDAKASLMEALGSVEKKDEAEAGEAAPAQLPEEAEAGEAAPAQLPEEVLEKLPEEAKQQILAAVAALAAASREKEGGEEPAGEEGGPEGEEQKAKVAAAMEALRKGQEDEQSAADAKERIAEEAREAARKMGEEARQRRQAEIDMVRDDYDLYAQILRDVQGEIEQLRKVLGNATARQRERVWHRGLEGELDENRLVDAIAGEAAVFKRRAEREQRPGEVLMQPKRITFLFDTSSSMYHFNNSDGRLRRSCEAAVMLMEALRGFEMKFDYEFVCHGGDYVVKELVPFGKPPIDEKERLQVVSGMLRAAQFSGPGDNTLQAIDRACERVSAAGMADDYFVFAFSDGHLKQYGVTSEVLAQLLARHGRVTAVCFLIANVEEEALAMAQQMPDRVKLCMDLKALPAELRQQFVSSVARGGRRSAL